MLLGKERSGPQRWKQFRYDFSCGSNYSPFFTCYVAEGVHVTVYIVCFSMLFLQTLVHLNVFGEHSGFNSFFMLCLKLLESPVWPAGFPGCVFAGQMHVCFLQSVC
jgi:hypothetical protein